jgi:hypothetical protein
VFQNKDAGMKKKTRNRWTGGVLGNDTIVEAIEKGWFAVDPWEQWHEGQQYPLAVDSLDVRLGLDFIVPPEDEEVIVGRTCVKGWLRKGTHVALKPGEMFPVEPGMFVVSQTLETLFLPTKRRKPYTAVPLFTARFGGVSELARFGFAVEAAPFIHPSPKTRPIVVEIFNQHLWSRRPKLVEAGKSRIGQVQFSPIIGPVTHRNGRFDGQATPHGVTADSFAALLRQMPPLTLQEWISRREEGDQCRCTTGTRAGGDRRLARRQT